VKLFRILAALILLVCLAPGLMTVWAGWMANRHGCTLHEGFTNPCIVGGQDIGGTLYTFGMMGWFMIATLPIAAAVLVAWIAVELIRLARRRHARAR
jgi:hypothetical protein